VGKFYERLQRFFLIFIIPPYVVILNFIVFKNFKGLTNFKGAAFHLITFLTLRFLKNSNISLLDLRNNASAVYLNS
jgi:hypothetical protein